MTPLIPIVAILIGLNLWQTAKKKGVIKHADPDRASETGTAIRDVERDTDKGNVDYVGVERGTPANRMPSEFRGISIPGTLTTMPVDMKITPVPRFSIELTPETGFDVDRVHPATASHILSNEPHTEPTVLDQRGVGGGYSRETPIIPDTDEHIEAQEMIEKAPLTVMPVEPEIIQSMPPPLVPSPDPDVSLTDKAPSKLLPEPDPPPLLEP